MAEEARQLRYPDGLREEHAVEDRRFRRHASPLSILIFGGLLAAALAGLFAGGKARPLTLEAPAARMTVTLPRVLRNGLFFETRIAIDTRAGFDDLTLAVSPELWRDMTINTMIPAAGEEDFKDGAFRFHYGRIAGGDALVVKIDGQINPPLFRGTQGSVALYDGDRLVGTIPIAVTVLP